MDPAAAPPRPLLDARRACYGPNTSLSYDAPIHVVRGAGAYLYDEAGNRYLDCVNNVAHVGHGNPAVAEAVSRQLATVNTNSRYLSQGLVDLSQQLLALLPPSLEVVYLCNSGSEANDLALRVARAAAAAAGRGPGAGHVATMGGAYHGHLTSTMAISPYKFWGAGGAGKEPWVHVLPCPDPYRGEHLDGGAAARGAVAEARAAGGSLCAFICESVLSCGGQVFLPDGYLAAVHDEMRAAGAVVIADEVQCGFGRLGGAFWGFELSGVTPDIVVMGKPIGNGFPLAAVAMTRALASTFATQEYFNTFGGCNAAAAAGLATLGEVRRLGLQRRAGEVGAHLLARLRELQARHPDVIGDVRGRGLFLGVDVVRDAASKAAAPALARWLKEEAKARFRVLLSTDGPYEQVIKIKPPLVFTEADADELAAALGQLLSEFKSDSNLRAAVAAEEARVHAARTAPLMAVYADNAARVLGLGGAPHGAASAAGTCGSSDASGSPRAAAAGGGGGGGRKGKGSLLQRVMSWASNRSSESCASDWGAAPAAAAAAAPAAGAAR